MKRILIGLALLFLSGNALFASAQVLPVNPSRLVVSGHGTLINILNADGTPRFGKLTLDGFRLTYQVEKGPKKTIWANGETDVRGVRFVRRTAGADSITVTVRTYDNALVIKNRFILTRDRQELIIIRTIRNNSGQRLHLSAPKQFLDPKLLGIERANCATVISEETVEQASYRVTAYDCAGPQCVSFLERPPHFPPCLTIICMQDQNTALMAADVTGNCKAISLKGHAKRNLRKKSFTVGVFHIFPN
jgi:hypothetical protein